MKDIYYAGKNDTVEIRAETATGRKRTSEEQDGSTNMKENEEPHEVKTSSSDYGINVSLSNTIENEIEIRC